MRVRSTLVGCALLLTLACEKHVPPPPPPPPAVELAPWSYHVLGGIVVIEGEVDCPTDLFLDGQFVHDSRHVEFGPVRWERYLPPKGEIVELRNGTGKLLARWDFSKPWEPPAPPPQVKPQESPQPNPAPQAPAPKPLPPSPPPPAPKLPPPAPKPVPPAPKLPPPAPKPVPPAPKPPPPAPKPVPPPSTSAIWPGSGESLNYYRGPRGGRRVCITFDGGSSAEVALDVLNALRERGIRTTFFITGAFIRHYPDLVRRMAQEGHEIGNHTLTHPHLAPGMRRDPRWTRERFQAELLETDRLFYRLVGRPMDPFWRAPYGEQNTEIRAWAEELGYRHIGWSEGADTLDWATVKERRLYRSGNAILDRLGERMERQDGEGLIVLMHLGSGRPEVDRPARILGPFLDKARQGGWTFTTVGTYLRDSGKPVWDSQRRLPWIESLGARPGNL